jgi:hypothetical protein
MNKQHKARLGRLVLVGAIACIGAGAIAALIDASLWREAQASG